MQISWKALCEFGHRCGPEKRESAGHIRRDTPIGQIVLIGNFRRRLARELLVIYVTKFELLDNHHHVQKVCTCHENSVSKKNNSDPLYLSRKVDHQNTRFPLRLPPKMTTMCEDAHGTTTRAQSL